MAFGSVPARRVRWPKLAAAGLLLITGGALAVMGVGEMLGGDASGVQHLVEVAPLVALGVLAWRWPRRAGGLLAGTALALLAVYLAFAVTQRGGGPIWVWFLVGGVLFVPPLLAGLLFWISAPPVPEPPGGVSSAQPG